MPTAFCQFFVCWNISAHFHHLHISVVFRVYLFIYVVDLVFFLLLCVCFFISKIHEARKDKRRKIMIWKVFEIIILSLSFFDLLLYFLCFLLFFAKSTNMFRTSDGQTNKRNKKTTDKRAKSKWSTLQHLFILWTKN